METQTQPATTTVANTVPNEGNPPSTTKSDVADVVFAIEATCNTGAYMSDIKNNYILPTLEHFNGGPISDLDCGSVVSTVRQF